jgi:hypothetical protein
VQAQDVVLSEIRFIDYTQHKVTGRACSYILRVAPPSGAKMSVGSSTVQFLKNGICVFYLFIYSIQSAPFNFLKAAATQLDIERQRTATGP